LGGAASTTLLTAGAIIGVATFSGLAAFSCDLAGCFVDCLLAGFGEE
jgi:hypothetical protein